MSSINIRTNLGDAIALGARARGVNVTDYVINHLCGGSDKVLATVRTDVEAALHGAMSTLDDSSERDLFVPNPETPVLHEISDNTGAAEFEDEAEPYGFVDDYEDRGD